MLEEQGRKPTVLDKSMDTMNSYNSPTTKPIFRVTQILWYLLTVLEVFLVFRFFLRFAGANPYAGFTSFMYGATAPFVAPFVTVFRITYVAGTVFDWTTLLAMFVYWLVFEGIVALFVMHRTVSTPEAAAKLEREDKL